MGGEGSRDGFGGVWRALLWCVVNVGGIWVGQAGSGWMHAGLGLWMMCFVALRGVRGLGCFCWGKVGCFVGLETAAAAVAIPPCRTVPVAYGQ